MASCPMRAGRPQHFPYSMGAILDAPARITKPASVKEKVWSWTVTPKFKVELADMLDNRHLPPLTLKDFEEYLLFVEHSAENLYFFVWLREYTQQYAELSQEKDSTSSGKLALSFARAMATFFTSKASYQLNLPHEATESLLLAAQKSSHPPPSDFIQARQQVELMLSESLARFVFLNSGNAGPHRKFFSSTCGVSIMGIGLIPVLVSILEHKSRWLRFAAFPFFWMGAVTLVAALHSVCMIIYFFGDARQMQSFELAMPVMAAPMLHEKVKASIDLDEEETRIGSSFDTESILTTAAFIKPWSPDTKSDLKDSSSSITRFDFDFDSLPDPAKTPRPESSAASFGSSSPMFAPLTKVLSPLVTRAQWEIVMRSGFVSIFIAAVLQVIVLFIPPY